MSCVTGHPRLIRTSEEHTEALVIAEALMKKMDTEPSEGTGLLLDTWSTLIAAYENPVTKSAPKEYYVSLQWITSSGRDQGFRYHWKPPGGKKTREALDSVFEDVRSICSLESHKYITIVYCLELET